MKDCSGGEFVFFLTHLSRFILGEAEVVVFLDVGQFAEATSKKQCPVINWYNDPAVMSPN